MVEKILDERAFEYYAEGMNEKMNSLFTKGIGCCKSCGAPYNGKAKCEYCGRNFFITNILTEARELFYPDANETKGNVNVRVDS